MRKFFILLIFYTYLVLVKNNIENQSNFITEINKNSEINQSKSLPVAIFHGIGDACHFGPLKELVNYFIDKLNTQVKCIEIGNGFISSWFMQFKKQSEQACEKIKNEEIFKDKFSVVGISQGSLIGRYIIQKCDMKGQVVNYVSINGPQMGIGSLPKITCPIICPLINSAVSKIIYDNYFQNNLGPAGYYKYRYSYEEYVKYSSFLADLNNEKEIKNEMYKKRFSDLQKVLLIKNSNDTVITPKESSWFEFYDYMGEEIISLKNSDFYINDYLGLRILNENNRLFLLELEGDHVSITYDEIEKYILPILK
jgi:palmitoyl-protein thioesterase